MWRKINVSLQPDSATADQYHAMASARILHVEPTQRQIVQQGSQLTIGHIAHELNSLLDGSMRCLALAEQAISQAADHSGAANGNIANRLHTAHQAMQQMARLLGRAMETPMPDLQLFDDCQTLQMQVQQITETLLPFALECQVELDVDLTPKAATLPTAMLGPVILNGLRNAIEACACSGNSPRRVELSIAITPDDQLLILISDTGPGAPTDFNRERSSKPAGHGYGLDLCRQIVAALGGELRLTNIPFGNGAILQVMLPLQRLIKHA